MPGLFARHLDDAEEHFDEIPLRPRPRFEVHVDARVSLERGKLGCSAVTGMGR